MKHQIDTLMEADEAQRAVGLYEVFLSGCYEKADDVDDSGGNLGMFFQDLFVSWIRARQEAGGDVGETVCHIVRWMDNDDYGFCYEIEGQVAKVLDKKGAGAFSKHFHDKLEAAFAPFRGQELKPLADCPYEVRGPAGARTVLSLFRDGHARDGPSRPQSECVFDLCRRQRRGLTPYSQNMDWQTGRCLRRWGHVLHVSAEARPQGDEEVVRHAKNHAPPRSLCAAADRAEAP